MKTSDFFEDFRFPHPPTWATPESDASLSDVFSAAARNQMVAGTTNIVAETAAREEAYDRRIEAVRQATGVTLENPERGGYSIDARRAIRQEVLAGGMAPIDEKGGIPAYQKRIFDQKVAELQQKHPELQLGDVGEEAKNVAIQSGQDLSRAMTNRDINPLLQYGAEFAGSMWGSRRDPLFLGSLFAGPISAVGKAAIARIASSALNQGLFNAGVMSLGYASTQQWRTKIGQETGLLPSMQDVGLAFLMGAIPGAGIEGAKELAGPLRRLMRGEPQAGDITKAVEALGPKPEAPAMAPEDIVAGAAAPQERAAAEPERIRSAAYAIGGKTYEAPVHVLAMEKAVEDLKLGGIDELIDMQPGDTLAEQLAAHRAASSGFVTTAGRYVSRDEAKAIAEAAGQGKATAERGIKAEDMQMAPAGAEERPAEPVDVRTMRAGEESLAADRAVLDEPPPSPSPIHDELVAAALQRADDPEAPSPQAVAAVDAAVPSWVQANRQELASTIRGTPREQQILDLARSGQLTARQISDRLGMDPLDGPDLVRAVREAHGIEAIGPTQFPGGSTLPRPSIDPELQARIEQAAPRNAEEAKTAADHALDDFGRRDGMAELRRQMVEAKALEDETTEAWRADETREKPGLKDVRNKIPMVDRNGNNIIASPRAAASYGRADELRADLIRSCK